MKILKNILSQFHTFLLWAMASVLLWSWIYTLVNDAPREKKVTVFINAVAIDDHALALRLEEHLPDGIRKIKVHDFEYGMIGTDVKGDIYVVRASQLEQMLREKPEAVLPITVPEGCIGYDYGGSCYGLRIFDAASQTGAGAGKYIWYAYLDEPQKEDYYLCFGTETVHVLGADGAVDNAAWEVAMELLSLEK